MCMPSATPTWRSRVSSVVLDTDVASLVFRNRLPATMRARLAGKVGCLSFVTVGEMTQWARVRDWAPHNDAALGAWLGSMALLECGWEAARTWGYLSAEGRRRGRPYPINDTWIAACCLTTGLPLATFNTKDFADFSHNNGLELISPEWSG
jgi:predicted nucleic acid-binding protein